MSWNSIKEGVKHVLRSFWLSATAVSVLTVSLGSVLIISSISAIIGLSLRQFDSQISIVAFFKDEVEESRISQIQEDIAGWDNVKSVEFIDNTEAQNRLSQQSKAANELILSLAESNVDLNLQYLEIYPESSEDFDQVLRDIEEGEFNQDFEQYLSTQSLASRLREIYYYMQIALVVFITIFGLISILVIANILRITVYSLREEIEIMRLVGATNGYIVSPFLVQSGIFAFLANLILGFLYFPMIIVLNPSLSRWVDITGTSDINFIPQLSVIYIVLFLVSMVLAISISFVSTKRYLQL